MNNLNIPEYSMTGDERKEMIILTTTRAGKMVVYWTKVNIKDPDLDPALSKTSQKSKKKQ